MTRTATLTTDPAPAAAASVTERVCAGLAGAIMEGRLAPGQRLVEADVQLQYGAGRSSVREALVQLQARGLVSVEANRGASVRMLSRKEVRDLFAIRERLEALGAGLAAGQVAQGTAPAPVVAALRSTLVRMDAVVRAPDALAYGRLNRELHQLLLQLGGNPELVRLVNQLSLPVFQQQFRGFLQPDNQRASHAQHRTIAAAVLSGDTRGAEAAMRQHVRDGCKLVLRWPDAHFAPQP